MYFTCFCFQSSILGINCSWWDMAVFPSCHLFWQRLRGDNRSSNISCHSWIHWRLVVKLLMSEYLFWTFLFAFLWHTDIWLFPFTSWEKRAATSQYRTCIAIRMCSLHCRIAPWLLQKSKVCGTEREKGYFSSFLFHVL